MYSKLIGIFLLLVLPLTVSLVQYANAGGARSDWSDFYDNVEGAPQCWQDGYEDGLDHPFNQDIHKQCQFDIEGHPDFGKPYYEAFIYGCIDAGNTRETCEKFTDD